MEIACNDLHETQRCRQARFEYVIPVFGALFRQVSCIVYAFRAVELHETSNERQRRALEIPPRISVLAPT